MTALVAHRGPDGRASGRPEGRVALAHRRLSVIDIAGGSQRCAAIPEIVLVFNGEIYNYGERRRWSTVV